VVEAHVHYHRPARYGDQLQVSVVLVACRGASVEMRQEVRRGTPAGELLVSATVRAACLASDSLRPRPLPAALAALS
jgi:acyl-CoA thioester hydrolase